MEKQFYKFPSIGQFRDAVKSEKYYTSKKEIPRQVIEYVGTVKLHGTNAGIVLDGDDLYAQSRNRILELTSDNNGFAYWVESNKEEIKQFIRKLKTIYLIESERFILWGEWVGQGIQKGVAISNIEKSFFVFQAGTPEMLKTDLLKKEYVIPPKGIYFIKDFPSFDITIDFNDPAKSVTIMEEITAQVEKECPVAKMFGHSGIGEGVVYIPKYMPEITELWFKVKGDEHSASKVNTGAKVSIPSIENKSEVISAVITENRLNQGIDFLKEMNKTIDRKSTGDFIRWVINDIWKEDTDFLIQNNVTPEAGNKIFSEVIRKWYFNKLDQSILN